MQGYNLSLQERRCFLLQQVNSRHLDSSEGVTCLNDMLKAACILGAFFFLLLFRIVVTVKSVIYI